MSMYIYQLALGAVLLELLKRVDKCNKKIKELEKRVASSIFISNK